jgi:hypothetical protein
VGNTGLQKVRKVLSDFFTDCKGEKGLVEQSIQNRTGKAPEGRSQGR